MKLLPARQSSSVSCTAPARSTTRRSRSCGRCSCKLGGHAARMAMSLRSDGRLARSFPISTILLGLSSAGSTMPPLQLFQSHSVRRSWRVFRGRSPIPQSSMLFGMTRSYGGEGHSSACARQPVSKLKQRGEATKRENIRAYILTYHGFFDSESDILKPRWLPTCGSTCLKCRDRGKLKK